MKVCPVCKTPVFDDMESCYGCMYRFGSRPELEHASTAVDANQDRTPDDTHRASQDNEDAGRQSPSGESHLQCAREVRALGQKLHLPEIDIPNQKDWILRIEMREPAKEAVLWRIDLTPPFVKKEIPSSIDVSLKEGVRQNALIEGSAT